MITVCHINGNDGNFNMNGYYENGQIKLVPMVIPDVKCIGHMEGSPQVDTVSLTPY